MGVWGIIGETGCRVDCVSSPDPVPSCFVKVRLGRCDTRGEYTRRARTVQFSDNIPTKVGNAYFRVLGSVSLPLGGYSYFPTSS